MQSIFKCFHSIIRLFNYSIIQLFKQMSRPSYSGSGSSYSIPRVPRGLTADAIADAIAHAIAVAYGTVHVQLVPAKPIFRYGGVQHAAMITMSAHKEEAGQDEIRVVYDLEAQAHFTLRKMKGANGGSANDEEKRRLWRWALRGIVIQ